jgi:hypothetical protein
VGGSRDCAPERGDWEKPSAFWKTQSLPSSTTRALSVAKVLAAPAISVGKAHYFVLWQGSRAGGRSARLNEWRYGHVEG